MDLPNQASVVIVGGGIIGCSLAYHLTLRGCRDVVLLERKQLTCGTTWHAAGLVGQLRATYNLTRLAQYTTNLYASLEQETGQATGFRQTGSVAIATHQARFEELKRGASMAKCFGLEVQTLTPSEIASIPTAICAQRSSGPALAWCNTWSTPAWMIVAMWCKDGSSKAYLRKILAKVVPCSSCEDKATPGMPKGIASLGRVFS